MIKKLLVHRLVLCVFFAVFSTLYTTTIWAACTDENGSSYLPTGAITPIELEVLKQNNVITGYQDTNNNKIVDLEAYVQGEEWSVYFPESNKIISGVAVCGPSGKADGAAGKYVGKQLSAQQAYCGCYCKQGTISDDTNYVSVAKLDGGLSGVPNKTNYCRANCPQQCAQLVAESASFRTLLYGGADNCPVGTPGEGGGTEEPGCAKTATDYCDVSSDCEYVLKSAYSVGYTMDSGDDYCVASPNEYTILLSTDGNDVLDEVVTVYYGSAISGLPVPTADGMGFVGWFDENGNEYSNGTIYKVADDIILYAKWGCELPVGDAVSYSPTTAVSVMTLAQLRADYPNDFSLDGSNQTKLDTENAMALYNQGQRFSVQYENGWIHGTAFCGPAGSVTGDPRDQLTVYQAGKGCWCRYGTEDTKSATGFKWVGTKELKGDIDTVCRAECPSVCAEYTATNSTFRSNLLEGTKCPEMDKNVVQCDSIEGYSAMYNASTGECEYTVIKYTITLDSGESVQVDIETIVEQVDVPSKENYRFGGYYTGQSATGTMIYDENGYLVLKTEEDKKQYLLKNQTLYADWIEVFCTDDNGMVVWNGVDNVALTADLLASGVVSKKDSIVENEYNVNDFAAYTADQRWAVYFDEYGLVSGAAFCGPKNKATYGNVVTDIITGESGATVSQAHSGCWCRYGEPVPDAVWVSVGNYHDNGDNWATRTDACRKECPRACATAIATDKNFRTTLYGDAGNCPAGSFDEPILCAPGDYMDNGVCVTCPESHPNSVAGSTSQNQCYTSCTAQCVQPTCPDNSATCSYGNESASGNLYYDTDYCAATAPTCSMEFTCNENFEKVDGECVAPEFTIETVEMAAGSTFSFKMSASGTFYVDCGDGGTLSGTGVSGNTITRNNTTNARYTCTYPNSGTHKILFSGDATGYATSSTAAISFSGNKNIKTVDGSLGAIFSGSAPYMFNHTFYNCTSLTSIPETLFAGVSGSADYMFSATFSDCTSLTSIPENLFAGVSGSADSMFNSTFRGCTSLTSIPEKLFADVSGSAEDMFLYTFHKCTSLTSIPENLFAGVSGSAGYMFHSTFGNCTSLTSIPENLFAGVSGSADGMFSGTFEGCTSLTSIPENLFAGVSGSASDMFAYTFDTCTSLTSIPENLFAGVSGSAPYMFRSTFYGCSGLESVPAGLFAGITDVADGMFQYTFYGCTSLTNLPDGLFKNIEGKPAENMFKQTFYGCTKLTGHIPANTFEKMDSTDFDSAMMTEIFNDTALATTCPSGTYQYITGFESAWDGHVACTPCPSGMLSPAGSVSIDQCSTVVRLHIGDDVVMNLVSARPTTSPVMVFQVGDTPYYAPMSATETPINSDTNAKYRVLYNETEYWVHDYTAQ